MNHAQTPEFQTNIEEQSPALVPTHSDCARPLHRLSEARQQEKLSRRTVARHLGITIEEVKRQEDKTTDLPLSIFHKWAEVLDLPVAELFEESGDSLSKPLFNRAHLIRIMKTAMAILERTGDPPTKRLAQTMVDQLIEIMPELRGISAWLAVGKRRRPDELGIAAQRSLSDKVFRDVD